MAKQCACFRFLWRVKATTTRGQLFSEEVCVLTSANGAHSLALVARDEKVSKRDKGYRTHTQKGAKAKNAELAAEKTGLADSA